MTRPVQALIDSAALAHNLHRARELSPGSRILAVIKADGYGHGMLNVARALHEADGFAVAGVDEAMGLREAGIDKTILLLEGFFHVDELDAIQGHQLDIVIHHDWQLEGLERAALPAPVRVWLKVDTGMHRLGFAPERAAAAWRRLQASEHMEPVCLMTHLARADEPDSAATTAQLQIFSGIGIDAGVATSIANSAAILGWPASHADWNRPGILLYGSSPFVNGDAQEDGLKPVMHLRTGLIAVHHHRAGDGIGYGGSWQCPEDMPVGVAAIGYGDGYPRHAPAGTPVLVNDVEVPLVGRVSMDMITLDLRACPDAAIGDPVTLWGPGLPADAVARRAGTIAYELFCQVTQRVPRILL